MKRILVLILHLFPVLTLWSQSEPLLNQWQFLQNENPSFFGFNHTSKAGVLYNNSQVNLSNRQKQQYLFGAISFPNRNFSIGFEMNNYSIESSNFTISVPKMAFVYTLQISQRGFLLPALSIGYWNKKIEQAKLIYEDQINKHSGAVLPESIDPLNARLAASNYPDIGASLFYHNDVFFAGLALSHLNQPNIAFDTDNTIKGKIRIALQGGGEWNINPYERGLLPDESFLFITNTLRIQDNTYALNLSQELQLGELSIGVSERITQKEELHIDGFGFSLGLALDNFDVGMQYFFPLRNPTQSYSPRVFELFLIFEFTPFRRNGRGSVKRLQISNY